LSTHSNATNKNVSWPHFSWPTLYAWYFGAGAAALECVLKM